MLLEIHPDTAPIMINDDGVAFVGGTRVRLETIITAFRQGDSAEQIVDNFDVLTLADIYAVIAYYLRHRDEVNTYMQQHEAEANELRRKLEAGRPDMFSLRERLLARKQSS
jgi:uncharacterized protein (DUF433 family)